MILNLIKENKTKYKRKKNKIIIGKMNILYAF